MFVGYLAPEEEAPADPPTALFFAMGALFGGAFAAIFSTPAPCKIFCQNRTELLVRVEQKE